MKVEYINSTKSKKIILLPENEDDFLILKEFFLMFENTNGKIECKHPHYSDENNFSLTTFECW